MKALVLENIGQLTYKETKTPVPKSGELLVKVMAAGICGSDIPRAYRDGAHNMPLIIGHEFSGIVEAAGDDKNAKLIGKRVGIFPLIPCGECVPCQNRQYEMCRHYNYLGSRCNGGFAQYVTVPEWNLIEIPDTVSYEAAAMIEPMAVAVHAMRQQDINTDDNVVVCGVGTIGMMLTMFLIEKGIKNIFILGNKDFQRKKCIEIGIQGENFCDVRSSNPQDFISDRTDGKGAEVFFECVGSNEAISWAVENAAPSGRVCFVGNPHSDITFEKNIYWKILRNQLKISGTWNSSYTGLADDDWHYVLDRLDSGAIDPQRIITHRYSLDKISKGMEIMRDKLEDYIKIICAIDS